MFWLSGFDMDRLKFRFAFEPAFKCRYMINYAVKEVADAWMRNYRCMLPASKNDFPAY